MRYYKDIEDILLYNWWKVREGKLEYCRINHLEGDSKQDLEAYIQINDSYIKEFGIGLEMQRVIELRTQILSLQCDYVLNDDNYLRNEIRKLQKELDEILNKNQGGHDNDTILIYLEKWMGFRLDEKQITAKKFYKIVKQYEKEHKNNKK